VSFDIPQPFRAKLEGPVGPVSVDGIPSDFHFSIDALPKIAVGVDPLSIGVEPLSIGVDPLSVAVTQLPKISIGLDPLTIKLDTISVEPVDLNLSITRIPDVRAHFPADFTVGMKVLGLELFAVRLTGEAQVITEPFEPNPCETITPPPARPVLVPLPDGDGDD
jgi:hypothetical protein